MILDDMKSLDCKKDGVWRREERREVGEAEIYCCCHTSAPNAVSECGTTPTLISEYQHKDLLLQLSIYSHITTSFGRFFRVFVALHLLEVAKREIFRGSLPAKRAEARMTALRHSTPSGSPACALCLLICLLRFYAIYGYRIVSLYAL